MAMEFCGMLVLTKTSHRSAIPVLCQAVLEGDRELSRDERVKKEH